ncbi:hypothetical protein BS47DRAFT_597909 [Hydnum rufescens UP504]|uniref:Uncharacterized protein n=1 Tax=Hydnum rufescens UP504 TaxID=1448309 RepID=A0A9P6AGR8_9AGAM|nr:hypothetical protein BS47DRAFT_597909 [Hydnum rufescens UP504]
METCQCRYYRKGYRSRGCRGWALPPSALPVSITVAVASQAYGMYQRISEIPQYLMGYVIDMTIASTVNTSVSLASRMV